MEKNFKAVGIGIYVVKVNVNRRNSVILAVKALPLYRNGFPQSVAKQRLHKRPETECATIGRMLKHVAREQLCKNG
jgi:hypothetical protein